MAVEAVVSVVIQKVTDLLIQDAIIFDKVIDQVEDIRVELRQMRGYLTDAEEYQNDDTENGKNAKKWVAEYLETLYRVEDVVESYVLRLARKKHEMGFFQSYGVFFHDLRASHNIRKKMKVIEEKIKELNENKPGHVKDASLRSISFCLEEDQLERDQIEFDQFLDGSCYMGSNRHYFHETKRMSSSCSDEHDSDFVGFEQYANDLINRLTEVGGKMIPVVGPLGSGKTTLVRRIYNRKSTKMQFDCRAWIDVSEDHTLTDYLLGIWNQVNKKKREREVLVIDKGQLLEFLEGQKYLIVLDDARSQPDIWKHLIDAFPDMGNGSKVLLTSRQQITDSLEGDSRPLLLKPLRDEEGWKLFTRILSLGLGQESSLFLKTTLHHRILKKCQGLPFNIALLAGLLSTKRVGYGEWTRLFNQANWHTSDVWSLSYNDIPVHYKLCLLYVGLFPKEFDISVRRILRLWLAEGFIRCSGKESEDLAEECFNYLVNRNLIKISKFRSDGGPKKCLLPGFVRERLSKKAHEISLFHIHNSNTPEPDTLPPYGIRRIVEYADIKDYAPGSTSKSTHIKNLRSYLSFNFPRYDAPAKEVGNFLCKIIGNKGFGMLRVLDLEGVYKPNLPHTLKHLFQLRYMGLRWTFLDTIPESVGDLPYLETLDLKRTYVNNLPSSVWKLEHLRHLYLPQVRLDMNKQQPSSQLLTLWGLIIDDEHSVEKGLRRLDDLRELGITCRLNEFDKLMNWITSLTRLQSLSLTCKDDMGRPSTLSLDPLSELGKLSHLKLLGKLSQLLTKDQFPPNLKVLTLSVSHLSKDPMSTLSQLPCLAVLRLLAKSYLGQKMYCPQNGFRELRALKIWMLEELEEWIVEEGGMPHIREINIRHCHNLKEIPFELLKRETLEELILDDMPKELEEKTRNDKHRRTILTVNPYTFTPLPWEKDPELWN